jgi:hypothetical protein
MSAEKLNELLKQAEELTADEKIMLARSLLEQARLDEISSCEKEHEKVTNIKAGADLRNQEMKWLKEHQAEYGDLYVALDGEQLVGYGKTYREAADAARKSEAQNPFIIHVPAPITEYFGGWQ